MTLPALRARGLAARRRAASTCRSHSTRLARPVARAVVPRRARGRRRRRSSAGSALERRARDRGRRHRRRVRALPERASTHADARPARREARRASAACSATPTTSTSGIAQLVERPGHARSPRFLDRGRRPQDDRRRGQRRRRRCSRARPAACAVQTGLVRNYALGDRARRGRCCSLYVVDAGRWGGQTGGPVPDPHRDHRSCRSSARSICMLHARRAGPSIAKAVGYVTTRGHVRPRGLPARAVRRRTRAAFQFVENHAWMPALGVRYIARRRRHQPVHGGAHRAAVPDRPARVGAVHRAPRRRSSSWLLLLEGVDHRHVPRARPRSCSSSSSSSCSSRCTSSSRAGARQPALRGDEVLPLHRGRLGVPVRVELVARVPAPGTTPASSPSTTACSPQWNGARRARTRSAAVPRRSWSRSRSRCRCSRSTRGCPTRTPTRRPRARSCWPACS